jgi:ribosomal protein S18 acetylase RimI-like enzyme
MSSLENTPIEYRSMDASVVDLAAASFSAVSGQPDVNTITGRKLDWRQLGIVIQNETSLQAQELERAAEIYVECFTNPPWNENWTVEQAKNQIMEYLINGCDVFVARLNGEVVGVAVGMPLDTYSKATEISDATGKSTSGSYYITDLAVDPSVRGKGLAQSMVGQLESVAWNAGYEDIVTRTKTDNSGAIAVFHKRGFVDIGVYETTTGGQVSERVIMQLDSSCPVRDRTIDKATKLGF